MIQKKSLNLLSNARMAFALSVSFIVLTGRISESKSTTCPSSCDENLERYEQLKKTLNYLKEIKKQNMEYMATLGPSQESQKIKAKSNINIANKRINKHLSENSDLDKKTIKLCLSCEDS